MDDRVVRGGRHVEASVPDVRRTFLSACDRCAPGFADVRLIAVVAGQPVDHTGFFISVRAVFQEVLWAPFPSCWLPNDANVEWF